MALEHLLDPHVTTALVQSGEKLCQTNQADPFFEKQKTIYFCKLFEGRWASRPQYSTDFLPPNEMSKEKKRKNTANLPMKNQANLIFLRKKKSF